MPAKDVDFSHDFFQASGVGRSRVKHVLFAAADLRKTNERMNPENENTIHELITYRV